MQPAAHTPAAATLRWVVNTADWEPGPLEFQACLQVLSEEEQQAVAKYVFEDDRKRALVSRLLQRACVRQVCGLANTDVQLQRTRGKKPFSTNAKPAWAPNFNFNVSHEGDYTALASEPLCVCGVDVAAPQQLRRAKHANLLEAISQFKGQFAASEWDMIMAQAHDEPRMEACFQRLWSLKEAFVKARGDGLGFEPLSRAEFSFVGDDPDSKRAHLTLDGVPQHRWSFELQELAGKHWVSVARGPPECIVDAFGVFTGTLGRRDLGDAQMQEALLAPAPAFQLMHVRALLPPEHLSAYMGAIVSDEGLL